MAEHVHVPASRQLRVAISIVASAAADRKWGTGDRLTPQPDGRLRVNDEPDLVDAGTVYQAARGVVGALVDHLAEVTGRSLEDVVGPWLTSLQVREAMADLDLEGLVEDGGATGASQPS